MKLATVILALAAAMVLPGLAAQAQTLQQERPILGYDETGARTYSGYGYGYAYAHRNHARYGMGAYAHEPRPERGYYR